MSLANPRGGTPRIHSELMNLGISISQAAVAKYIVIPRLTSTTSDQATSYAHLCAPNFKSEIRVRIPKLIREERRAMTRNSKTSTARPVPKPDDVVKTFAKLPATYQVLFFTGAVTGLRRGELVGLCWQDVDLDRGTLHVRNNLQRIKKSRLDEGAHRGSSGSAILVWCLSLRSRRSHAAMLKFRQS